jgi:hypothetical protein
MASEQIEETEVDNGGPPCPKCGSKNVSIGVHFCFCNNCDWAGSVNDLSNARKQRP